MGLLNRSDWKAQWVVGKGPAFPWIRKTFTIEGEPRRGTAYVCVMGYYELYVNGNKVGNEALVPAVSDYTKRALYLTTISVSISARARIAWRCGWGEAGMCRASPVRFRRTRRPWSS